MVYYGIYGIGREAGLMQTVLAAQREAGNYYNVYRAYIRCIYVYNGI